jgi:hypothetical protein
MEISWHEDDSVGGPGYYRSTTKWCDVPLDDVPAKLRNSEGSAPFNYAEMEGTLRVTRQHGGPGNYPYFSYRFYPKG